MIDDLKERFKDMTGQIFETLHQLEEDLEEEKGANVSLNEQNEALRKEISRLKHELSMSVPIKL